MFEHYIFGKFIKSDAPLNVHQIHEILNLAERALGKIQDVPIDRIIDVLDKVYHRWMDKDYPLRKIALERMPSLVGYSKEMTEVAIDSLFTHMKRENLSHLIRAQIGKASLLDHFEYVKLSNSYLKAQPLGIVLHVSPGNVFVGGVDSLMYGILSKNVNILKLSHQDPLFPFLFVKSLKEVEEDCILADAIAILNFSSKDEDLERELKKRCDGIVVIGGEDAVKSYRRDLPVGVRLVEYGPRYSFSIVTAKGYKNSDPERVFTDCAWDVIIWEQRACSSPQVIYVEKSIVGEFLEEFPRYLEAMSRKYPQENLSLDDKIEILKAREAARFQEVEGTAILYYSPRSMRWTVIYEKDPSFKISPLNRTIYVKPFSSWADILSQATKMKNYLQTVGFLGNETELKTIAKALVRLGVSRITKIGTMGVEKIGAPHDFDFPLARLVKWVSIDWLDKPFTLGDKIAPSSVPLWKKIRRLLSFAFENSSFYKEHLSGIDIKNIRSYKDFLKVPLTDKTHIYQNTPPQGEGMLTAPLKNAYVFASGGSTGTPKFNFYSFRELEEVSSILAEIYQIAGIQREDVVANLFMAGFLWTSFIVVNQAIEKIGCVSLPIAGNADIDLILHYMNLFRPTAVLGLPSMIIQLAEEIMRRKMDLKIEKILYGGEHFGDEALKFLRESVGARIIQSAGYASVDAGPIGYQCREVSGGVHHLLHNYVFLEIIDPEKETPVEEGQVGEIVVTNLHRRLMPIVRYRTGDLGKFIKGKCPCGHPTPLFELLGRCDDVLRIGAMSIYPPMISEALSQVEGLSPLFQMIAEYDGVKEKLTIKIEALQKQDDYSSLSQKAYNALLSHDPELELVVKEKWLGDLIVEVIPPNSIPRNPRTGKIKKVIDKRTRKGIK